MKTKVVDRVYSVLEFVLVVMFVQGGVNTFFANPLHNPSPFLAAIAGQKAIYFYAVVFFLTGVVLLYAKWAKKKKLKSAMLQTMFLTCVYVLFASWALVGIQPGMIITVVTGAVSLACYLHWRLKIAYLDPQEFYDSTEHLRHDRPPQAL